MKNFSRVVSMGYLYCRHALSLAHCALAQCCFAYRTPDGADNRNNRQQAENIMGKLEPRRFKRIYVLPASIACARSCTGAIVIFLAILLMSGLNIFNAHPGALLGQVVLQRRSPPGGDAGPGRR